MTASVLIAGISSFSSLGAGPAQLDLSLLQVGVQDLVDLALLMPDWQALLALALAASLVLLGRRASPVALAVAGGFSLYWLALLAPVWIGSGSHARSLLGGVFAVAILAWALLSSRSAEVVVSALLLSAAAMFTALRIWPLPLVQAALVGGAAGLVLGFGLPGVLSRVLPTLLSALLVTSAACRLLGSHAWGRRLAEVGQAGWATLLFVAVAVLLFGLERARELVRRRRAPAAGKLVESVRQGGGAGLVGERFERIAQSPAKPGPGPSDRGGL